MGCRAGPCIRWPARSPGCFLRCTSIAVGRWTAAWGSIASVPRAASTSPARNSGAQQAQPAMCNAGTRTVVDRGLARSEAHERTVTGHAIWAHDADRILPPRSRMQIESTFFVQWLAGLGCEATGIDQWLYPAKRRRKLYSTLRVGRQALARSWPMEPVRKWLQRLRELPEHVLDQMIAPS